MDGCAALTIQSDLVNEMGVPLYLGSPGEGPISLAFGMQNIEHLRPTPLISINQSTGPALFGGRVIHTSFSHQGTVYVYTRGIGDSTGLRRALNIAAGKTLFENMHLELRRQYIHPQIQYRYPG